VFVSENSPALEDLEQRGLLAPLAASTLAATPPRDNSATGLWVGVAAHASLLVYNTGKLKPSALPTSILGLADPEWHGELALAPNETDFQPIVIAVAAREGQAKAVVWLDGVRDNAKGNVYSNNAAIVAQVNAGRAALAVIDPYYWYALRDEVGAGGTHSAVRLLAPGDPGYIVDVSGAGVLKSSRHQVEAQRFVAFMVSREGQQALTGSASYEYPLAAGVASPRALLPWAKLRPDPITPAGLGTGQVAVTLLQQVGLL
jgi:iron(III) transport system substrate-binding protein